MPTQYVHEDHVTIGDDLLFPNVQSCAAIIVETDASTDYGGYHITVGSKKVELDAACQYITNSLLGNVSRIYVIGNYRRDGASGVGSNSTLADALRKALNTNSTVHFLQSPDAWLRGIAVRAKTAAAMPVMELRIAAPGNWSAGANADCHPDMRKVKPTGAVDRPRFPLPTAKFNGTEKTWALGSLQLA